MKIKINVEGKEQEFNIKLTGQDVLGLWDKLQGALDSKDEDSLSKVRAYVNYRDGVIVKRIGWKLEQLNDLPIEEKRKITLEVENITKGEISFSRPS